MKSILVTLLLLGSAGVAAAPEPPARPPGYDALQPFVGRWTEKGHEDSFVEVCHWFDGRFHVVCHAERKHPNGSVGRSLSILSHVPGRGYVHVGIGSDGSLDTLHNGTFEDGVFQWLSAGADAGRSVVTRIRIGPFAASGTPFVVDISTDDGPWVTASAVEYVALEPRG